MELKEYQKKVTGRLRDYLAALYEFKGKAEEAIEHHPEVARDYNFPQEAWQRSVGNGYHASRNGLGKPLPEFYIKVPTGGGKTLLACHAIDLVNKTYLKKQTGLVLWIVPTTQIYGQTIGNLRNREHPYRQVLDISSGGRTLVKEKADHFNRLDIAENLVVLMLMLPSANRQNKETLKVFQDSGAFTGFFPPEDNYAANQALLERIPNLDCFGGEDDVFGRTVKTSMGNVLKVLQPVVIIDEGHRAYSDNARRTIRNFNPAILVELSATPPANTNKLVAITGRELNAEEMIKLDIHLTNKSSLDWKDTMLCSVEKRGQLEQTALEYEQNTGTRIRPINLIQVENTGKGQRTGRSIHAEDVKEFLIRQCNIPQAHIAIKSSDKDDIEGVDLFAADCETRYIITKYALQEGWDCSFAYILTILANPGSQTGITQLIGRILRQPFARKTGSKELDECYVYTFRQNAAALVNSIKANLESEGLGDIAGHIALDSGDEANGNIAPERELRYRDKFRQYEGKIYLPKFVVQEENSWRDIMFEADILSRINWLDMNLDGLKDISLSSIRQREQELVLGLSEEEQELLRENGRIEKTGKLEIDEVFLTQQLLDIIPNPWIGHELGKKALQLFFAHHDKDTVSANFVFIVEELKKVLEKERNRLAEGVFRKLVEDKKLCFFLLAGKGGFRIPPRIKVRSNKQLIRDDNAPLQKSLFDYVPEENVNELEKSVAIYLDQQEKLLWWYRNISRQDYHIQGWKKNKIYPDFIASGINEEDNSDYGKVYVLETKGLHLKNEDTRYKQDVFALCNDLGAKRTWKELDLYFPDRKFEFQVVFEDEWKSEVNRIFA